MGIDIYTGSLTRYYLGLWESQLQVMSRERRETYTRVTPSGEGEFGKDLPKPQETFKFVKDWMSHLSGSLGFELNWNEGVETPYYTLQYSEFSEVCALVNYAHVFGSKAPDQFPNEIDFRKDKVLNERDMKEQFNFLGQVELFLPISLPEPGIYELQLPNQKKVYCSSNQKLLEEMNKLSQKIWGVSMQYLHSLSEEDVYNKYAKRKTSLALAIFGLCKLYENILFSQQNNVPILLDY